MIELLVGETTYIFWEVLRGVWLFVSCFLLLGIVIILLKGSLD